MLAHHRTELLVTGMVIDKVPPAGEDIIVVWRDHGGATIRALARHGRNWFVVHVAILTSTVFVRRAAIRD